MSRVEAKAGSTVRVTQVADKMMIDCDDVLSDGYHTFPELYKHRCALFICLMNLCPKISWVALSQADGLVFEGWMIAGMNLPTGQITYHIPEEMFLFISKDVKALGRAEKYDGHTSDDVVKRLEGWAETISSLSEYQQQQRREKCTIVSSTSPDPTQVT